MSWSTLFAATNGTASGGNGYTRRIIIAAGSLAGTATTVRVLFHYSGTGSYTITDAYIGLRSTSGDAYDIDPTTLVRLQLGGSNTITVTSGAVYSDSVSLVVDGTRDIVVSLYGGTALHYLAGTVPSGLTIYHRLGNYAAVSDATSFAISGTNLLGFRGLEGEQLDSYTSSGSFSLPFFSVNGLAESTSVSASGSFSLPALSVNGNGEQGYVPSVINGHPWCQQYSFNSNSSTSLSWTWVASDNGTALSTDGGMFLTNGRVYFILGDTTGNVFYNTIGEDGVVNPVRVNVSSLPIPRKGFGVFLTKNKVFLIGGQKYDSGWIPAAEILSNTINTDGSIGSSWSTESLTLGGDRSYHSFALTKNNVYCIGGASYYGGTKSAGCLPIAIGSDGSLGSLSGSTYNMLEAAAQTAYIDLDTKLYILGNNNRYVQQSTIADNGLIGAWSWASSIPYEVSNQGISSPGVLVTSGNIFIIGGYRTGVGWSSDVITAPLSGTTIGTYSLLGTVPNTPLAGPFVFTTSSRLYVVCSGGYCYSSFTGGANNYLDKSYSADTPAGVSATGQVSLPLLAVNGQAEYTWFDHWKGNFNLKPFSVNGQGAVSYTAAGSFRLKCFSVNGSATYPWTAYGNYRLPGLKIRASGPIDGRFSLPLLSVNASFSFPFNTVVSFSLPLIKISGVAEYTMPIVAKGEISLPLISISGKAHDSIAAFGLFRPPLFSIRGTFYSSFISEGRYVLPSFTVKGSASYASGGEETLRFERDDFILPTATTSASFEILQFVRE